VNKILTMVFVFSLFTVSLNCCANIHARKNENNAQSADLQTVVAKDIDWFKDNSLKLKKFNVDVVRVYYKGIDVARAGLSGMTITDKYIIFAQITKNENNTILNIVDKDTYELLGTIENHCFRHANDMTFNNKTNEVLIVVGPKKIAKFKINDEGEYFLLTNLEYIDCPRTYSGIAYDDNRNQYMAYCSGKMYVLNDQFKELFNFPLRRGLIPQGMAYHNNLIYYSCYETGKPNTKYKVYNSKEKGSNVIYVYDLKGSLKRTLYIPNTFVSGEIENLDFMENGKLLIGYNVVINGKKTVTFYQSEM